MAKRKFLKPAQVLAAAVASIAAGSATSSAPEQNQHIDQTRISELHAAVESGAQVGTADLILQRPGLSAATLGYHQSHSSHQSHRSHQSHSSHQSHTSHYSSSW